jgi:osmoprotectant transport system permease protein
MDFMASGVAWLVDPANWSGADGIPTRLAEHVAISGVSVLVACLIAVPIGLWIGHTGRHAFVAINLANIGRAVPSYAVMAIILPLSLSVSPEYGLALIPTFLAMTLLAIPPVLVNTYAALREVDRDLIEAARGMGMREREVLRNLEIPIGLPIIVGGIRTAAVQVVATATLGAVFGLGGLGRYLIDGIARRDIDRLFAGVVLVAGLALLTELMLALLQRRLTSAGLRAPATAGRPFRQLAQTPQAPVSGTL